MRRFRAITIFFGLTLCAIVIPPPSKAEVNEPSWLDEAYLTRVLLQPPRLYTLDDGISLDEAYFVRKLTQLTRSTGIGRDWSAALEQCKRKPQTSCATGSAYSQLLNLAVAEYARKLFAQSNSQKSEDQAAQLETKNVLQDSLTRVTAPPNFDVEAEFRQVDAFLKAVLLVRYGREQTFTSVQSPDLIAGWMRQRAPKSARKGLQVPSSQNPEVAILQIYSQNLCPLLQGRENLLCRVMFERAPLNSLDYLYFAPGPGVSQQAPRLVDYQVMYIAGQEPGSSDWWRSLFPLRYGEFGGLSSGWGDRATLALRRSKRPLPEVIVNGINRRISELSGVTGALSKPFLQQVRASFPEAPLYVSEADLPDNSISIFGFEVGGKKKATGPEVPTAAEFLKRLSDPATQVSLRAGDSDTIASLLAPGLVNLGSDAYKIQATWKGASAQIVISEPILLNEYSRCLMEGEVDSPSNSESLEIEKLTFARLLVFLHAHAIDLAALDSQVKLDPDARAILELSPFFDSLSYDEVDLHVGREGVARGLKAILEVLDKKLAPRLAKGWQLPSRCVVNRLTFAIAHELAHIVLGSQGEIDAGEQAADCVGYLLTRALKVDGAIQLSAITQIGPSLYWNARSSDSNDLIRARQARLDSLSKSIPDAAAATSVLQSIDSVRGMCFAK